MFEDEDREFHEDNRENDYHDDAYDRMNESNDDEQRTSQEMWEDDGQESVKEDPQSGWVENHPNAQIPDEPVHGSVGMPPVVKRIAGVAVSAVLFGVIAGGTMFGVNQAGNYLRDQYFPKSETQLMIAQAPTADQGGDAASSIQTGMDVSEIASNAMPSVVAINNTMLMQQQTWFGPGRTVEVPSSGSGIIVGQNDSELLIVTNNHVVEDSNQLTVTFIDNSQVNATIKGTDADQDLAVIAVSLKDIPAEAMSQIKIATLGDSDALKVGQGVVAIGNALGYGQSVTVGYISALNREISASDETVKVLQTDAAINPGNSGGALVNMQGELIGINTAKYSDTSVEGMGYALPISDVQDIINDLIAGKNVSNDGTTSGQAYLGISAQTITSQYAQLLNMPEGVYISSVEQGSAAEECGLQSGDIICSLDGEDIADMETFHDKIVACNPGDKVTIVYYRNNNGNYEKQTATATLKEKQ